MASEVVEAAQRTAMQTWSPAMLQRAAQDRDFLWIAQAAQEEINKRKTLGVWREECIS